MSRRILIKGVVLLFMIVSATTAFAASVTLTTDSGGSIAEGVLVYNGDIAWSGLTPVSGTYAGTIIKKEFTGLGTLVWEVNFASLDFAELGAGLRWVEEIANQTGVAWTDYHLRLDNTSGVFFDDTVWGSPSLVTLGAGPSVTINSISEFSLSADRKSIDIVFGTPIAPGGSFAIYAPIVNLYSAPGVFTLEQNPTVPLPTAVWAGFALLGGLGIRRRMRRAT